MYEIIDNNGTIHSSSSEDEMRTAFEAMTNPDSPEYNFEEHEIEQWEFEWEGDLKLIHVLETHR